MKNIDTERRELMAGLVTKTVGTLTLPTLVRLQEPKSAKDLLNLLAQMGVIASTTNVGYDGKFYTYLLHTNTKRERQLAKDLLKLANE